MRDLLHWWAGLDNKKQYPQYEWVTFLPKKKGSDAKVHTDFIEFNVI